MKFTEFSIDALIEWLKSAEKGLDPHCKHKCWGEIHLYNDCTKEEAKQSLERAKENDL